MSTTVEAQKMLLLVKKNNKATARSHENDGGSREKIIHKGHHSHDIKKSGVSTKKVPKGILEKERVRTTRTPANSQDTAVTVGVIASVMPMIKSLKETPEA